MSKTKTFEELKKEMFDLVWETAKNGNINFPDKDRERLAILQKEINHERK